MTWKDENLDSKNENVSNKDLTIDIPDSNELRKKYTDETGKNPFFRKKQTNAYKTWLKNISKHIDEKNVNGDIPETAEKSKQNKNKKKSVKSWKDEISEPVDENLKAFLKDIRPELKEYILKLKTEKTELENKLKDLDETGYIVIIYGIPGVGKSTFCASGVLVGYTVIFIDLTDQGRRLQQYKEIYTSKKFIYEPVDEKDQDDQPDLSKNFEKISHLLVHVFSNYDPKTTIIVIDGWSKVITALNSYLRRDILKIGDPKHGKQYDIPYGDWYWRTLRYSQLLFNLESGANNGFRIFLTAEVKDITEISTDDRGKLKITKTGERAPNVRDEDLYTGDVEAFFRYSYDPKNNKIGPRELEIKVSKVPGFIEGTIFTKPSMEKFLDTKTSFKKLDFGD